MLSGGIKKEIEKFLKVIFLTMNKPVVVRKSKTRRDETRGLSFSQEKSSSNSLEQPRENLLRAKILSKQKTPLPDI